MKLELVIIRSVILALSLILVACGGTNTPDEENNTITLCDDNIDNDSDGLIDFPNDPGCDSLIDDDETDPVTPMQCNDSIDNDSDGLIDFPNDPGCDSATDNDEDDPVTALQCNDGADNDSDGLTDFPNDPGCDSLIDDDETDTVTLAQCNDSLDNDSDGFTDFPDDPGCDSLIDDDETDAVTPAQCDDSLDNDSDGFTDFPDDPGCDSSSDNDETDPFSMDGHTAERANSYDDAWESAWITNVGTILSTPVSGITKTTGKVLQVGDSMTFSFAYGLWARSGAGQTSDDFDTVSWMFGDIPYGVGDTNEGNNGWNWSFTGVTAENNSNWFHPLIDNIYTDTRLNDAQIAVIMFNAPFITSVDMTVVQTRVNEFIAAGIVPVLSTIPPRKPDDPPDPDFDFNRDIAIPYNAALHELAESNSLPIIDYYAEILLRRPGDTWIYTLIGTESLGDGVHPSGGLNGYHPESDPYADGGDPTTHTTGNATLNSGYLLRTWLTVQKIKEIKEKVID